MRLIRVGISEDDADEAEEEEVEGKSIGDIDLR
jgi:hypothetical protein